MVYTTKYAKGKGGVRPPLSQLTKGNAPVPVAPPPVVAAPMVTAPAVAPLPPSDETDAYTGKPIPRAQ